MRAIVWLAVLCVVIGTGLYIWAYSGSYDIGADSPHWPLTSALLATIRDRSVEAHSARVQVPNLDDPKMIAVGAAHYSEMCVACHRAPGAPESEMRQGLYPKPPDLTRAAPPPAESFWVIKHGIKMSGMPAWGKTHDDRKIWAMAAFLQKLPVLDAASYRTLTQAAPDADADDEAQHGHDVGSPEQASLRSP